MPYRFHETQPEGPGKAESFPTTQWSVVLHAGAGSASQARVAMEKLCRQYWYPLYGFVRRQGRSHHEAEDCTQEFLTELIAKEGVARARAERGRFRSFLLTSLRNFLVNEWHRERAAKRGGGLTPLPLAFDTAEKRFAREVPDSALTPEQAFDHNWAQSMIDRAVADLRTEYEKSGRGALFAILAPHAWGNANSETLAQQAARFGLTGPTFTVALHRFRRRIGEHLRMIVAETVTNEADINTELRYLIAALGSASSAI